MIKSLLLRNLGWKLLSVALASLLWLLIAREPETATAVAVPVLFKNIPDDLDIGSGLLDRVQLSLRGPSQRLTPESLAQTAVVFDLSNVPPGEHTFTIREDNVRDLPIGVAFYRAVPSQVTLRFEKVSSKSVPIQPVYENAPPQGYAVVSYTFSPQKALIRGPERRVRGIGHVDTDPIDLSGVTETRKMKVRIRIGDPQVRLDSPQNGYVQIKLVLAKTEKGR